MLEVTDVCKALTSVWVAVLQAALEAVIRANTPDGGAPARIAVIGMGRLGGGELGYGSDADVMFVCEPVDGRGAKSAAVKWSVTIAEQVRALLGTPSADPPLEVDADLRPEGRSGPLVRTLASYEAYYAQWAQPWEIQALLRAHRVAGDAGTGGAVPVDDRQDPLPAGRCLAGDGAGDPAHQGPRGRRAAAARRRPEHPHQARARRTRRHRVDGAAAAAALCAHKIPALHNTSTLEALNAIGAAELIAEGDVESAAAGVADGDAGAQRAGAGARQADRPAARARPSTQRGGGGGGLGQRRRRRVPGQLPAGDPPGKSGGAKGVRRMSMDFAFDVISAEEYERQRALYGPLTESLAQAHRRSASTPRSTSAPCSDARAAIEALTELLEQ